jgi:hypothetical protein
MLHINPNRKIKKSVKFAGTFFLFLLIILVASLSYFARFSLADLNFSGFGWLGNDLVNGLNTNEPAVGWASFSSGQTTCGGSAYAVTLGGNQGDDTRPVSGYAWFGIGSASDPYSTTLSGLACQSDAESIGWVNFQAGAPAFCNTSDCHPAEWHRTGSDFQGYIDGWAKIVSMGDDGWIRLKGPTYGLSLQQDGLTTGDSYGWNSGGSDISIGNNAGLGWTKFANAEICSIAFPSASQTIPETANSLSLIRNRAAGFPVSVNLTNSNPSRLSLPTNPITFPAGQASYSFPISITEIPSNICTDSATVTEQSICGQSGVALTILQNCSLECSPEDVTIMPGETVTFTASVKGYSDPSVSWSYSGEDSDCVKSATANSSDYTLEFYTNTSGGKYCAIKSFQVKAQSNCVSCGSGTCKVFVSRPGWIESTP